jgi:hypothetical protein
MFSIVNSTLNLYGSFSFDICHMIYVMFIVLYGVLTLYCVFETCKVKSVLIKLYFE